MFITYSLIYLFSYVHILIWCTILKNLCMYVYFIIWLFQYFFIFFELRLNFQGTNDHWYMHCRQFMYIHYNEICKHRLSTFITSIYKYIYILKYKLAVVYLFIGLNASGLLLWNFKFQHWIGKNHQNKMKRHS
jgi:hypothetical protein